jgi:signal transduction histidine kinase/ActR/RegA family two-component response regulator/PAS domain-containing protein
MKKEKNKPVDVPTLRQRAEERLRKEKPERDFPSHDEDQKRLLHELQVHQIELEMQNEELQRTRDEIQIALNGYTDLYDFAPIGYATLDRKGMIRKINLTGANLIGIERARLIRRPFSLFVQADMRRAFDVFLEKTFESKVRYSLEVILLNDGGQPLWVRIEAEVYEPEQECRAALFDITQSRQIEAAQLFLLEHSWSGGDFFQSLARFLARTLCMDFVCIDRLEGDNLYARTVAVYFDGKFEDNVAYALKDTPCGNVVGKVICSFPKGVRHLFPKDEVLQEISAESYVGTTLWSARAKPIGLIALISRKPMANSRLAESILKLVAVPAAGELERRQGADELKKAYDQLEVRVQERTAELQMAYDRLQVEIAERKQMEEQLLQARKMEAIGALAGGIAHDFNNILAAIIGFSELIAEDLPPENPSIPHVQRVLNAASRGRDLVQQILAFSRKTGRARHPVSLSALAKETVHFLRASIPTTIDIVLDIAATSDTILATPVEVQQVLMNLATNASLAMQEHGGILHVNIADVGLEPESPVLEADMMPGEYLQLVVSDTGTGMTPDVIDKMFEPFFTTREVGQGTGMGLAVAYGIVKSLHGCIMVESKPGVGSTFNVLFPKVRTNAIAETPTTEQSLGKRERILFIDDEEFLVEWGQALLERLGYEVTSMNDGTEAFETFSSDPSQFDLVITDQAMPGITGLSLAREILKIRPHIPIILCTGHSDAVTPESLEEAGVTELLMKPLAKQELAEVIRRVLDDRA